MNYKSKVNLEGVKNRMNLDTNLSKNELDTLIDDIDSEYFSFEYAPIITKTQRNSISSIMKIIAERVNEIFKLYRTNVVNFKYLDVYSCNFEEFADKVCDDSILFTFDFDEIQCEMKISTDTYKNLTGIQNLSRKEMSSADFKLCFDFVLKPILSEILKKFNSRSINQFNFRTPKVIEVIDIINLSKKCVCINFEMQIANFSDIMTLVFPIEAFEKLVRLGVFSNPRRPLQNPFKYNASVVLDRIYLDPNIKLEVGAVIETIKTADDPIEIIKDGRKIADGELVAVREMFGVRKSR